VSRFSGDPAWFDGRSIMPGKSHGNVTIIHYQAAHRHDNASYLRLISDTYSAFLTLSRRNQVKAALKAHRPAVLIVDYGAVADSVDAVELETFRELVPDLRILAVVDPVLAGSERISALARRQLIHNVATLPVDPQVFLFDIARLCDLAALQLTESASLCPPADSPRSDTPFDGYIGADQQFLGALTALRKAARTGLPVLVTGESGTGKELAAQLIHAYSEYRTGPLLAVNCAGFAPNLIASELFGHEKGAFTDAKELKIGKIEAAAGGTLFLDEIGDLPLDLQGFLLRFIEEKTIERVGGTRRLSIDTRIVAATNVDLAKGMAESRFRKDLFYRLNVLSVHLPPLRERGTDSLLLARHFLDRFKAEFGRPHLRLRDDALDAILHHDWPGNVRELIGTLRRAVLMAESSTLGAEDLRLPSRRAEPITINLQESIAKAERTAIELALRKHRENVNRASRELGVSRVTLYRLMQKHEIPLASRVYNSRQLNGSAAH
jgi:DNA-binding NtrC family response regulator